MAISKRKQANPQRAIEPVPTKIRYESGIVSLYTLGAWLSSDEETHDSYIDIRPQKKRMFTVNEKTEEGLTKPFPPQKRTGTRGPFVLDGLEGVDLLDSQEMEVCRRLRLTPLHYLNSKTIMMEQSRIRGFYKKSKAQKMLRIDVNKTGKLYEFFAKRGWILSE